MFIASAPDTFSAMMYVIKGMFEEKGKLIRNVSKTCHLLFDYYATILGNVNSVVNFINILRVHFLLQNF